MNKTIITIIIVAVVLVGGYFLFKGTSEPTLSVPETLSEEKAVVTYTDTGYAPATLQIKKGETVVFKNQSSQSMWTASAFHPTHMVYPTTSGCLGSTFDACKGVQSNENWSFKFNISGTWKYHNHLSPGDIGTIIVQ
jgi:plastocyanin